jgi:regulatory protein
MPNETSAKEATVEDINPAEIRFSAMNFLARREHSLRELRQKLARRYPDAELVEVQLRRLVEEKLQSDQRFAENFLRHRAYRGFGPMKIKSDMRQRGLSDDDIALSFKDAGIDWAVRAKEVYLKKFGDSGASDLKEKGRRARFMQYRGFGQDHYLHLL